MRTEMCFILLKVTHCSVVLIYYVLYVNFPIVELLVHFYFHDANNNLMDMLFI